MQTCPRCGAANQPGTRFCAACGAAMAPGAMPTQPMPLQPAPMPQQAAGSNTTLWVVLGVAGLLGLGVIGMFMLVGGTPGGSGGAQGAVATMTASPAATAAPAPTPVTAPKAKPVPAPARSTADDGRQFLSITKLYKQGGQVWAEVDFEQLFTGEEAWRVAAEHGTGAENDYYILNENPKLRRFPIRDDAEVLLAFGGDPTPKSFSPQYLYDEFRADPDMFEYRSFWFTIKNGEVTEVEHMWVP